MLLPFACLKRYFLKVLQRLSEIVQHYQSLKASPSWHWQNGVFRPSIQQSLTEFQTRNVYFLNRFLNGCNKYCALAKHQGKKYAQESLTMVIILFRTLFRPTVKKWYFVTKIVLTYCEIKKNFCKIFEITRAICSNSDRTIFDNRMLF